jgi:pre-rRNA-processing protein TSR1
MALDDQIIVPDSRIESLISENEPDSMEGEQTWPTDQEIADAEERVALMQKKSGAGGEKRKKVPKGTSAYQAAWIMNSDNESEDEDCDMDGQGDSEEEEHEYVDLDRSDAVSIAPTTVGDEQELDEEEEGRQYQEYLAQRQKQQDSKDHQEFPDETDTPQEIAARVRFQRFVTMNINEFKISRIEIVSNKSLGLL